jgi:hypothetical protein
MRKGVLLYRKVRERQRLTFQVNLIIRLTEKPLHDSIGVCNAGNYQALFVNS